MFGDGVGASGITSSKAIAAALTDRGVPGAWGHRHWHPMQVSRVLNGFSADATAPPPAMNGVGPGCDSDPQPSCDFSQFTPPMLRASSAGGIGPT
jgi:hypothetical protein